MGRRKERVINTYVYGGRVIGETVVFYEKGGKTENKEELFRPRVSESDVIEILEEMSSAERIHVADSFPGVAMAAHYHGIREDQYVGDADIVERVIHLGCRNMDSLQALDFRTWVLVSERELEEKIFPELKPVNQLGGIDFDRYEETSEGEEIIRLPRKRPNQRTRRSRSKRRREGPNP